MDGRTLLALAAPAALLLAGCTTTGSSGPKPFEPGKPPPPPPAAPKPSTPAAKKGDDRLKPETCVTLGQNKEAEANKPETAVPVRDELRENARKAYLYAIETDAKYVPAHVALAKLYYSTGEIARGQEAFARAVAVSPKSAALHQEQGLALAKAKQFDAAATSLKKACDLDPDNKVYAKALGLTLARAGKTDEAYAALKKGMGEADAHFAMARMYGHLGQPDASRTELSLALKANPAHEGALAMLNGHAPMGDPTNPVRTVNYETPATRPAAAAPPAEPAAPAPLLMSGL